LSDENELQILFSKIYFPTEIDTVVRKKAVTQISFVCWKNNIYVSIHVC